MRTKWMLTVLLVFTLLASFGIVQAKEEVALEDPEAEWGDIESAWEVANPLNSTAFYGHLESEEDVDAFVYELTSAVSEFHINIQVPVCGNHFEAFYPSVAVIGPGFETPEDVELPFELPEGVGALILTEPESEDTERALVDWEPHNAYESTSHYVDFTEAGDYIIAVWEPNAEIGAYTLRTGKLHPEFEDFTAEDWEVMDEAFRIIDSGEWIDADCSAELTAR